MQNGDPFYKIAYFFELLEFALNLVEMIFSFNLVARLHVATILI